MTPSPTCKHSVNLSRSFESLTRENRIDVSRRLRRAILLNDLDLVKRIVNNNPEWLQNPNFNDKSNTSLHVAAEEGFLEIAQFLIDAGHEDKGISRNADHATPLMVACSTSKPGCVDVGKLLVSRFPRCVSWANKAGMDSLMLASRSGNLALVPILLTAGDPPCSPNAHDLDGNTALHHASAAGELKAIRILMQYGANPMAQNAYSWTPIAYSSTVAAEVYFKNLVAEVEKMRLEGKMHARERERQRHAGVRLVTREEGLESFARARSADDTDVLPPPPKLDWSPVESRRAMTPTGHRPGGWGEGMRARASSGD